jgi:parvulin-like peptidyl-prolyl isomerase
MVSFAKHGGREKARAKLDEALAELGRGDPFPDVAKRHSDHPSAKKGGQHDWYKPGDFGAKEVDQALFDLPVDQVSEAFETSQPPAFMVVKVTEREPAGRTPLADVQDEIRQALEQEERQKQVEGLLAKLRENAVVTKYVD